MAGGSNVMNVIIMSWDCISAFSSHVEAERQQLFISSKGSIEVEFEGNCTEGANYARHLMNKKVNSIRNKCKIYMK